MPEYSVRPDLHIDATALAASFAHGDASGMVAIVADQDPRDLVYILTQQLLTAIRSPRMTLDEWVALQAEKAIDSAADDA